MKRIFILVIGVAILVIGFKFYDDFNIKSTVNNLRASVHRPVLSLNKKFVCMINDTYMKKKQILVKIDHKKYYGSCQNCIVDLVNNRENRYSTNPITGKKIDKALAFIALDQTSSDNKVLYFSSDDNLENYLVNQKKLTHENLRSSH